ncbi:MAG TPA: tetratricopeptide repeat protein [Verrucomicrobiae bacterium]|nr:tetratricopeptide repeat protein [Verrucomicrobiae bacterium]
MAASLTANEEAQLSQTIEMFEVITQSQPLDYQSLEILKEAYFKLGRQKEVVNTSKRIAQAYVQLGQLSSAILEYESILQRFPDDPDVQAALAEIESKASSFSAPATAGAETELTDKAAGRKKEKRSPTDVDDGRSAMSKIFVDGKLISASDFNQHWRTPDLHEPPHGVIEPFIQLLSDKGLLTIERSIKLICDRSRLSFLPLDKYDIDIELARSFPREVCQRWCILPFDRMSKSVLVATANPFNKQAVWDLENATKNRVLWYICPPAELVKIVRKVFR